MITTTPCDVAALTDLIGPCSVIDRGDGNYEIIPDGKVSDKALEQAIAEHVPKQHSLEGLALLAAVQLAKGEIDEATACKIAGCEAAALVAEAEAWTLK